MWYTTVLSRVHYYIYGQGYGKTRHVHFSKDEFVAGKCRRSVFDIAPVNCHSPFSFLPLPFCHAYFFSQRPPKRNDQRRRRRRRRRRWRRRRRRRRRSHFKYFLRWQYSKQNFPVYSSLSLHSTWEKKTLLWSLFWTRCTFVVCTTLVWGAIGDVHCAPIRRGIKSYVYKRLNFCLFFTGANGIKNREKLIGWLVGRVRWRYVVIKILSPSIARASRLWGETGRNKCVC